MARTRSGSGQPPPPPAGRPGESDRDLADAMRVLGQQLAVLTGAVTRRQAGAMFGGARGGGGADLSRLTGLFGTLFASVAAKITAVLAPVAVVASAIASPTSGFGVLLSAMKVLGSTLGAVLLPGLLALSALVYAVSGYLQRELLPALKQWYQAVIDGAVEAAALFEAALVYAVRRVREFGEWLGRFDKQVAEEGGDEPLGWVSRNNPLRMLFGVTPEEVRARRESGDAGGEPQGEFAQLLREARGRLGAGGGNAQPGGFADRFADGLRKSMQEFRFQNAPPARYVAGTDLFREAQLAATNVSPFEKTAQDFMGKVLQVLGDIEAGLPRPALAE